MGPSHKKDSERDSMGRGSLEADNVKLIVKEVKK